MISNRRHSFPLQGILNRPSDDELITILEHNVYPLTEENLAIHTSTFPPSKDARRSHARIFVENQRPVVEMELILEQQREQEISSFIPILHNETTSHNEQQQGEKKRNWLYRLTHWIRLDNSKKRRYHHSWSAGAEKDINCNSSTLICQKRDSGISLFHPKRRSSSIQRSIIPTVAPPVQEELITFQYPKMVRKPNVDSIITRHHTAATTT
ncbi:unnamed protein product [Mucor hiemalis]